MSDLVKPKRLEKIDFSGLIKMCEDYIDYVDTYGVYHEGNCHNERIYQEAMTAIFGEKGFEFIDKRRP